jgi:hypothetical protein
MLPVSLASQRAAREPVYAIREEPPRVPKPSRHAERYDASPAHLSLEGRTRASTAALRARYLLAAAIITPEARAPALPRPPCRRDEANVYVSVAQSLARR